MMKQSLIIGLTVFLSSTLFIAPGNLMAGEGKVASSKRQKQLLTPRVKEALKSMNSTASLVEFNNIEDILTNELLFSFQWRRYGAKKMPLEAREDLTREVVQLFMEKLEGADYQVLEENFLQLPSLMVNKIYNN